jgi:Raf kinase inhibitor-like YbhB/YbcL family protein
VKEIRAFTAKIGGKMKNFVVGVLALFGLGFLSESAAQKMAVEPKTGLKTIDVQKKDVVAQFKLTSPTVKDLTPLPLKYTQTGKGPSTMLPDGMNNAAVNPPLEWTNVPAGTNAFVLMLYDHVDTLMWAVVNIPGDVRSLPEAIPNGNNSPKLPPGAFHRSYRSNGWIGPNAKQTPDGRWTYYWKLFPLDKKLALPENATRDDILKAMDGHLTGNKAVMITPCCDGSM